MFNFNTLTKYQTNNGYLNEKMTIPLRNYYVTIMNLNLCVCEFIFNLNFGHSF